MLRKCQEKMHKNEKFYNFRKLRNVLNSNKKKLVKIGRIADSLSTNEKKSRKNLPNRQAQKNQVSQKSLRVVVKNVGTALFSFWN